MMTHSIYPSRLAAGLLAILSFADAANAQFFTANKADLILGFRKTGTFAGSFELVVNIGNVAGYEAAAPGTTITVSNFTPTQLSAAFSSYNNLQWSVSSAFPGSTPFAGFPASTLWYTVPRASTNTQSTPPVRDSASVQNPARQKITGMGSIATPSSGATVISSGMGTTNSNNNSVLVREPVGDGNALSAFIADSSDPAAGTFAGTLPVNAENTTPASFTSAQRSDLYQACPDGTTDPTTGLTTGNAYFIGYFQFNSSGTMTFTRASAAAPPATTLVIQRAGNVSTISFPTANGATYTLYFTNSSGLSRPISTWGNSTTNITGDGLTHSFTDTTANSERLYSVGAH